VLSPAPLVPPHNDELDVLLEQARSFADAAHAPNTRRAYAVQWRGFVAWCGAMRLRPLPAAADTVALYVAALDREGLVPASVDVALAAIAKMHQAHALASPCASPAVAAVRVGLRRTRGTAPRQAAPLPVDDLRTVVDAIGSDLLGLRDRALLLLGWCSAVRRSDLVALDVPKLVFTLDGVELFLRRSKTDQEGAACPVRAWLDAARITAGPVRTNQAMQCPHPEATVGR
jgi:site-specific recombinase XerC